MDSGRKATTTVVFKKNEHLHVNVENLKTCSADGTFKKAFQDKCRNPTTSRASAAAHMAKQQGAPSHQRAEAAADIQR